VSKRDYYDILGVQKNASDQQIKSAYRKLALQYHPDRNQGNQEAEEKFKEAAEAYAILSDSDKRARYDRFGHAGVSSQTGAGFDPSTFAGFEDIFGGIFGDFFGGGRQGGPTRGSDLRYDLEITFEQSAAGLETSIQIPRLETCDTCSGSGAAAGKSPPASPTVNGCASAARAKADRRAVLPATFTCSSKSSRTSFSAATATISCAWCLSISRRWLWEARSRSRPWMGTTRSRCPKGPNPGRCSV
jgi:molecular chaperone DnaJ